MSGKALNRDAVYMKATCKLLKTHDPQPLRADTARLGRFGGVSLESQPAQASATGAQVETQGLAVQIISRKLQVGSLGYTGLL